MVEHQEVRLLDEASDAEPRDRGNRLAEFPWWAVALILILIWAGYSIYVRDNFREAFNFIIIGIRLTVITTLSAYGIALVLGLLAGLGRRSHQAGLNKGCKHDHNRQDGNPKSKYIEAFRLAQIHPKKLVVDWQQLSNIDERINMSI